MILLKRKALFIIVAFCSIQIAKAQKPFIGSFVMTFDAATTDDKPIWAMMWNIDSVKMAMEIQDDMIKRGVTKRVLFDPADSSWTMSIKMNNLKQGTRMHAAAMFRNKPNEKRPEIKKTKEKRFIEGYNCQLIITQSKEYTAQLWITNEINFNLCKIYKLVSHCGMMSEYVRKGDWYLAKNLKGMVLQVTSEDNVSKQSYTMNISQLAQGRLNAEMFNLSGFKISDIPEGAGCGPTVIEK